jgi:hypothetical protein
MPWPASFADDTAIDSPANAPRRPARPAAGNPDAPTPVEGLRSAAAGLVDAGPSPLAQRLIAAIEELDRRGSLEQICRELHAVGVLADPRPR